MKFEMTSRIFSDAITTFEETTAPDWLTSCNTVEGSTMDNRWFWEEHVLQMKVGDKLDTDYQTIERVK